MNVLRDLEITGAQTELSAYIDSVVLSAEPWRHATDKEELLNRQSATDRYIGLATPKEGVLPDATLYLHGSSEKGRWSVVNIIPNIGSSLSPDQYNRIVVAFYSQFVEGKSEKFNVSVSMSSDVVELDDFLPQGVAQKLKSFSLLANMSTGSSHPSDQKRWFDFIGESFEAKVFLNQDQIDGFLQDLGWSEKHAHDLALEYLFGIDLLKAYSQRR